MKEEEKPGRYIDKLIELVEKELNGLSNEEFIKALGEDCSKEIDEIVNKKSKPDSEKSCFNKEEQSFIKKEKKEPVSYIDKLLDIVMDELDELSDEEYVKALTVDCSEEVKELSHKINNSQAKSNKTPGCNLN